MSDLNDWEILGLGLGLYHPTLEAIEKEKRGNILQCKMKMLAAWLKQNDKVSRKGVPSWSVLRAALKRMGENVLADKIKQSHLMVSCEYIIVMVCAVNNVSLIQEKEEERGEKEE